MDIRSLVGTTVMRDLGFNALSSQEQEQLVGQMAAVVFEAVVLRAAQEMNDDDRARLEAIFADEKNGEGPVVDFLEEHVADIGEIVNEELENFRNEAVRVMTAAREEAVAE